MKVFLRPLNLHSHAMVRVANALAQFAPSTVELVERPDMADLSVGHVIGPGSMDGINTSKPHVMIQYCVKSAGLAINEWLEQWKHARLVWSYYDLPHTKQFNFMHAPLGVDPVFMNRNINDHDIGVLTSGFVSGPLSEPIEEVAMAADTMRMTVAHLGPKHVEGMRCYPPGWTAVSGIVDNVLAKLYSRCDWVSGLRHIEGFELGALEGLLAGARPIVFDREDMQWYSSHAVFIPELTGRELVDVLASVFAHRPATVSLVEREQILERFSWAKIATTFWERVLA